MEPAELNAEVTVPVVLVSRDSLYVVVAVLSASILGCVTVLAYSFSNYNHLRRNAEEVRSYIASRAKVVEKKNSRHGGVGQRPASDLSAATHTSVPAPPASSSQNMGKRRGGSVPVVELAKDKLAAVTRQAASSADNLVPNSQHRDSGLRGGTDGLAAVVQAAASVNETTRSTAAATARAVR